MQKKWLIILFCLPAVGSYLSSSFFSWINTTYGENIAHQLNRADLKQAGSYGGGNHTGGSKTR